MATEMRQEGTDLHIVLTPDHVKDDRDEHAPRVAVADVQQKLQQLQAESVVIERIVADVGQLSFAQKLGVHTLLGIRAKTKLPMALANVQDEARHSLEIMRIIPLMFKEYGKEEQAED